jgi:hypothetical protein
MRIDFDFRSALGYRRGFGLWMWVPNDVIRRADLTAFDREEGKWRPVVVVRELQNGRLEVRARSASVKSDVAHGIHAHRPEDNAGDVPCATTKPGYIAAVYVEVDETLLRSEYDRCSEPNRTKAYEFLRAESDKF